VVRFIGGENRRTRRKPPEYFFRKKKHNPSLEVKWSLIESVVKHHKTKSNKPYLKVNTTTPKLLKKIF
jgi:hypothetical protein